MPPFPQIISFARPHLFIPSPQRNDRGRRSVKSKIITVQATFFFNGKDDPFFREVRDKVFEDFENNLRKRYLIN